MAKDTNKIKTKLSIRLEESLREQYHEYCQNNGYSLSKRLRLIIEKDMLGKITIN
jgi:hypothetical protein